MRPIDKKPNIPTHRHAHTHRVGETGISVTYSNGFESQAGVYSVRTSMRVTFVQAWSRDCMAISSWQVSQAYPSTND